MSTLDGYLHELGRVPLLSQEQEVALAKEIEAAEQGICEAVAGAAILADHKVIEGRPTTKKIAELVASVTAAHEAATGEERAQLEQTLVVVRRHRRAGDRAKARFVEANMRLVVSIAKKYANRGLQLLDLVQEGNIGLMRAVDKFDYRRGVKFSTYASWWIRQAVQRSLSDQGRTIRVPVHMVETQHKLNRVRREFARSRGREPTLEEAAIEMDLPTKKVRAVLETPPQPMSLETPLGTDSDGRIADLLADESAALPSDLASDARLRKHVEEVLKTLPPREHQILRLRFGFEDSDRHTLEEIGAMFALTRERIRQIEARALARLRLPSESLELDSYLR